MKDEKKVKATEEEAKKEEVETLNKKLAELSEEELEQVTGGFEPGSYAQIRLPAYAIDY